MMETEFFELSVLDRYRKDPRYTINEGPVSMSLSIKDEFYNDSKTPRSEKIDIQSLGYAYKKKDQSKVIVTYSSYLAKLSKKHQDYWASFKVNDECILDQDFFDQEFGAKFVDRVNIFDAFMQELIEINKLCELMNEPPFFRNVHKDKKPTNFCWITIPTYECYYHLIHLIDKLVSENINKDFFKGKVELQEKLSKSNDEFEIINKGTIRLLKEWVNKKFRFPDPKPKNDMIKMFKEVRTERQKPAHSIAEDVYDTLYFDLQKKLVIKSYQSIRTLRLILMNHPSAKEYKPPEWLQKGKIM